MKKRRLWMILPLTLFVASCADESHRLQNEIAKLPFSADYGFFSVGCYQDKDTSFEFAPLVEKALSKEGFRNPDVRSHLTLSSSCAYQNSVYSLYQFDVNEAIYYAAVKIDTTTREIVVFDRFPVLSLVEKGLASSSFSREEIYDSKVNETRNNGISFDINCCGSHICLTYGPVTLEKVYEGVSEWNYASNEKINDEYFILLGCSVYDPFPASSLFIQDQDGNVWDVIKTLKETEIYKQIKEIYPDPQFHFRYHYYILDEELYIEAEYAPYVLWNGSDDTTATMIFETDIENHTFEYLGYLPVAEMLSGIIKR